MVQWSMITVTYNSAKDLRHFWTGARPAGIEWIVVDNASDDGSSSVAEELGAKVIRLDTNQGFGVANNAGFRASTGSYVGFVNPDVTVNFATVGLLEEAIDRHGSIVAPQLLNQDKTFQSNGRGFPTLRNKIRNRLGADSHQYLLVPQNMGSKYVCWIMGAAVTGTRSAFENLGCWDERFFIYYEDSDICLRAWESGISVELEGSVQWTHGWARETSKFRVKPWLREFGSMRKFYTRYPSLIWSERVAGHSYPVIKRAMGAESSEYAP